MRARILRTLLALVVTGVSLALGFYSLSPGAGQAVRDYQPITFEQLGFPFKKRQHQIIPPEVMALNQQKVRIDGFMVPVDFQGRQVKSFVLVKTQNACCFGLMPNMNEWILVTLAPGAQAAVLMDHPVTVMGKMDVGEEIKAGAVVSLYRLQADSVQVSGS